MFEQAFGRLLGGALWGLGAGLVLAVVGNHGAGVKPLAKGAMKAYLAASDRLHALTAEARESLDDLYAEVKAEPAENDRPAAGDASASSDSAGGS